MESFSQWIDPDQIIERIRTLQPNTTERQRIALDAFTRAYEQGKEKGS